MRAVPGNAQHVGARSSQQDAFGFSELESGRGFAAVLADGMGGMEQGDQASRLAVRSFLEIYPQTGGAVADALRSAVREVNARVHALARQLGSPEDVGTTLVAAVVQDDRLHWISVGDSSIFLWRSGELSQLNSFHTYAALLDERARRGEITADQARSDPQRDALTSYVGGSELGSIDGNLRPFPLRAGDIILIASDGLDTLSRQRIARILQERGNDSARVLIDAVVAAGDEAQDNATVLTIGIEPGKRPALANGAATAAARESSGPRFRWRWIVAIAVPLLLLTLLGAVLFWNPFAAAGGAVPSRGEGFATPDATESEGDRQGGSPETVSPIESPAPSPDVPPGTDVPPADAPDDAATPPAQPAESGEKPSAQPAKPPEVPPKSELQGDVP